MQVKKILILLALSCSMLKVAVSSDNTLYSMRDLPLVNTLNPAFQPKRGTTYISFPLLSSINAFGQLTSTFLEKSRIVIDQEVAGMKSREGLFAGGEWRLFDFGYCFRDMYFTFGASLKFGGGARVNSDALKLLVSGNGKFIDNNQPAFLDETKGTTSIYQEYSLGFSKDILSEILTIGVRVKYLAGLTTMTIGLDDQSYLYTNPKDYSLSLSLYPQQYAAWSLDLKEEEGVRYGDVISNSMNIKNLIKDPSTLLKPKGHGASIDLGVSWAVAELDKKLTISFSIVDLGFIRWSKGYTVKPHNEKPITVDFGGIDMTNPNSIFGDIKNSLNNLLVDIKREPFTTTLGGRLFAGANYSIWKYLNAGFVFGLSNTNHVRYIPSYTLSVNTQNLIVNLSASYTIVNGRYDNLGVGVVLGRKYFQAHILVDNLFRVGRVISDVKNNPNFNASNALMGLGSLNMRIGINFLFGTNDREKVMKKD